MVFAVLYFLGHATLAYALSVSPSDSHVQQVMAVSLVFMVSLFATGGAAFDSASIRRGLILLSLISIVLGLVGVLLLRASTLPKTHLAGLLLLEGAFTVPVVVSGWRWASVRLGVFNGYRERVLILGTGESARNVCRTIAQEHAHEYAIVGFAAENGTRMGDVLAMGTRVLTDYASLPDFCHRRADRIIVALDEKRGKLPIASLMKVRMAGLEVEEATSFFERTSGKIAVETLLPSWLIFSDGFKTSALRACCKRASDLFFASILLVVSAPVMLLTAALIRLESRGPGLFVQNRVGLNGKEFRLLKFRSMVADAEKLSGPAWASKDDPRITRVGRIIRKLRIDELPQIINVLRGEMSFVGPRPERKHFVEQLERSIPFYGLRLTGRPGLTGWAQVEYGYGASVEENKEKLKYDLFYIKNGNLLLDLWIVLKTVKVVLRGSGAR